MVFDDDCSSVHCARVPWVPWSAPQRVVRIVRNPVVRMLSGYLDGRHLMKAPGYRFLRDVSFVTVVLTITSLPDSAVNPHMRRQSAMCGVANGRVDVQILRLEEFNAWRSWFMATFHWTTLTNVVAAPRTSAATLRMFYTDNLVRRVEAWAADDMERFGYGSMLPLRAHALLAEGDGFKDISKHNTHNATRHERRGARGRGSTKSVRVCQHKQSLVTRIEDLLS